MPLGTEVATTSGTTVDFTGIPAWAKQININLVGVSTSGTSALLLQIGDAGGVENTGYTSGAGSRGNDTYAATGFALTQVNVAARNYSGSVTICLENASAFTWCSSGVIAADSGSGAIHFSAGSKSTSAALDRLRLTTVNGTDTFDAGAVNISYR